MSSIEWQSQFNPFNSLKALRHWDRLVGCAKQDYSIPLTVNIDPTNSCSLNCVFCNSSKVVEHGKNSLSESHMIEIAKFLNDWTNVKGDKVQSVYISGGGEPLFNKSTPSLIEKLKSFNIESAIISNGLHLNKDNIDIILNCCRWIGISVDANCNETYNKMKGMPKSSKLYEKAIENIKLLVERKKQLNSKCDIGFKYLLHPYNITEIFESAKLAKEIGVNDFHLRPVRYSNFEKIDEKFVSEYFQGLSLDFINEQFNNIQTLNSDTFHTYGLRNKFHLDLSIKKNFKKCRAVALEPTFAADGNVYICFDQRGNKDLILCRHNENVYEIRNVWNTKEHHDLMNSIIVDKCPSCTFSNYNEMIEKVILKDDMCINFL